MKAPKMKDKTAVLVIEKKIFEKNRKNRAENYLYK